MTPFEQEVQSTQAWFASPRFKGIIRVHSAREVVEQRGTIRPDYAVARGAAEGFWTRLRELYAQGKCITTFGPYSPGQAVTMKKLGIEGIYLGGWATSAKGSMQEDPGPDLASYPLSQVPDEAAPIVRALLTADKNQFHARARMTDEQRNATPEVDFRPFIIADADTGHGGDAHVRNLVRRFVEVGVPGYHIEDQKPGVKKCGHQGGKVLVCEDEQIKRLTAARFQLDIMGVPGIIVARTDAESATLLDGRGDERDQPFILGATNVRLPTFRAALLAILRQFHRAGIEELSGHLLYAVSDDEFTAADAWLEKTGISALIAEAAAKYQKKATQERRRRARQGLRQARRRLAGRGGRQDLRRGRRRADDLPRHRGRAVPPDAGGVARPSPTAPAGTPRRAKARAMGVDVAWDCEHAKTPDGYYQVRGGIEYAIAKSLAVAPFGDILWMETKTADLHEAKKFAEAIHAKFPDKMLAYNLSPVVQLGHHRHERRRDAPVPRGAGEAGLRVRLHHLRRPPDRRAGGGGVRRRAQAGRHARAGPAAAEVPPGRVALPHAADAGGRPARRRRPDAPSPGRTATTKAMGKGSTQFQHLVQTEVPPKVLEDWLELWRKQHAYTGKLKVALRPHTAGSQLLELSPHRRRGRQAAQRGLRRHPGPARAQHPLGARPEHLRPGAAQEAPDDAGAALPVPSLQGRLGALRHARPTTT